MRSLLSSFLFLLFFTYQSVGEDTSKQKKINISGSTNYTRQTKETLVTVINFEYSYKLFEPAHKKWGLVIKGVVSPDYDHFQNEFKINTFTTLSFEF